MKFAFVFLKSQHSYLTIKGLENHVSLAIIKKNKMKGIFFQPCTIILISTMNVTGGEASQFHPFLAGATSFKSAITLCQEKKRTNGSPCTNNKP